MVTEPEVLAISPATIRSSVVLPQPDGPSSAISSPRSKLKLASSSATTGSVAREPSSPTGNTLRTFLIVPNAINPFHAIQLPLPRQYRDGSAQKLLHRDLILRSTRAHARVRLEE